MNKAELFGWIKERKSFLCVGLDPDPSRIPAHLGEGPRRCLSIQSSHH